MKIIATLDGPATAPRVREVVQPWRWPFDNSYPASLAQPPGQEYFFELGEEGMVVATLNAEIFPVRVLEASAPKWRGKPIFSEHYESGRLDDHRREYYAGYVESCLCDVARGRLLGVVKIIDPYFRAFLLRSRLSGELENIGLSINTTVRAVESRGLRLVRDFDEIISVDLVLPPDRPAFGGHFLKV